MGFQGSGKMLGTPTRTTPPARPRNRMVYGHRKEPDSPPARSLTSCSSARHGHTPCRSTSHTRTESCRASSKARAMSRVRSATLRNSRLFKRSASRSNSGLGR
jgi:hypothetical protein